MPASNYRTLLVKEIKRETEKAFLFLLHDNEEVWVPRSQVANPDDYEQGDEDASVSVTEWIANEKNLPVEED